MRNYIQDGDTMLHTAIRDCKSGDPVAVGNRVGVAMTDIAGGAQGTLRMRGVVTLPKASGVPVDLGLDVYLSAIGQITNNPTSTTPAGQCWKRAEDSDATIDVSLGPTTVPAA